MMIYLVEDDNSIRELVVYTLQSTGFEARGFACGADFWEGMKEDIEELVNKMSLTLHNTVTTSIRNFQKNSEECYSEIG